MNVCYKISFIIFILIPFSGFSQTVLNGDNIPQPGFEYIYRQVIKPNISIDTSGAGLIWDYSDFDQITDTISKSYWLPIGFYPSDVDSVDDSNYDFATTDSLQLFRVDSSSFVIAYEYDQYLNLAAGNFKGYFKKERPVFLIPFAYQDKVEHDYFYTNDVMESRILEADAWGKVVLPDTVYNNVLRLNYFDESYIYFDDPGGGWFEHSTTNSYEYFTEGSDVPVLIIEFYFYYLMYDWDEHYHWDTTILVYDHMDTLDCIIECPGDTTIYFQSDTCCIWIEPQPPMISHPADMATLWNSYTNDSSASSYYPEGTTRLTWYLESGSKIDSCSFTISVINTFGMNEYHGDIQYAIYPNPCNDNLNVKWDLLSNQNAPGVSDIDILSIDGSLVKRIKEEIGGSHQNITQIDISGLPPGIYFIRMSIGGRISSAKFLKVDH